MSERTLDRNDRDHRDRVDSGRIRLAWADFGGCTSADPDLFFPESGADTSYARSICRSCPVRRQCLDYALESGQKHGIWGGMTESQRRRLRRHAHPSNPADPAQPQDLAPTDQPVPAGQPASADQPPPANQAVRVRHLQLVR
jgi:WhiB family transcriptional regulator, redox-sensing transcriptional regulator